MRCNACHWITGHAFDCPAHIEDVLAENASLRTRLAQVEAERDAALREADRWRHGATVEGDFVCPNQLQLDAALARVREVEAELAAAECNIADFVEARLDWDRSSDAALYAIPADIRARAYRTEGSK